MSTIEIFETTWYLFWVCFICDLTVYTYEKLQRTEIESRQQLQLFLYAVAHDLKTPVLGLSMFLENLLSQPQKTFCFDRAKISKMIRGSDRQLHLLDSLLEIHHSESQGIVCHCQPVRLDRLVKGAIDEIEPILAKNEATLFNLVPDNLPTINADSAQLWRVYENLIINALKHNPPGVKIILKASIEKDMLLCSVEDNGIGISSQMRDRIFSLYNLGDGVRRSPGLGLGLYLCRQIIVAHQGKIGVNSFPGVGATFWFTLPIL